MSEEALNFIYMNMGEDPDDVHDDIRNLEQHVIDELMDHFNADSYEELAYRISAEV